MKYLIKSALYISFIGSLILMNSCTKDLDKLNKISQPEWNPIFVAPIAQTTLTLSDVHDFRNDSLFNVGDDNSIGIIYREDSLFSVSVSDLVNEFPAISISDSFEVGAVEVDDYSVEVSMIMDSLIENIDNTAKNTLRDNNGSYTIFPSFNQNISKDLSVPALEGFSDLVIDTGFLDLTVTNDFPVPLTNIKLVLYNKGVDDTIARYTFARIEAKSSSSQSVSMSNKTLTSQLGAKIISYGTPGSVPTNVLINLQDELNLLMQTRDIKVQSGTAVFPSQSLSSQNMDLKFETPGNEQVTRIDFSNASINYVIQSDLRENIKVSLRMPETTINGVPKTQIINITYTGRNDSIVGSIDLSGSHNDLSSNVDTPYNYLPITYDIAILSSEKPVAFNSTDKINMKFEMSGIQFSRIDGYLGQQEIVIDSGSMDLGLNFLDGLGEGFVMEDPKIRILVENSVGVPVRLDLDFQGTSTQGTTLGLDLTEPLNFPYPSKSQIWQTIVGSVEINKDNSGIRELIALMPNKISYSGTATINPDGNTGYNNFVTDLSKIKVGVEMDLPLKLSVTNLNLTDTISGFSLNDYIESIQTIEELDLQIQYGNGFPFDIDAMLYMYNDSTSSIPSDSVQIGIFESGIVVDGRVTTPTNGTSTLELSGSQIISLSNAQMLIYSLNMSTYNNGTVPVQLYTDYSVSLALGLKAKIKY